MMFLLVLLALLFGLAIGTAAVVVLLRRERENHAAMVEQQAFAAAEMQQGAVAAAVQHVLAERGATAAATAQAVTADREVMVAAAVDNAVKVASAALEAKLAQGSQELQLRSTSFNEKAESISGQLDKVHQLVGQLQKEKAQQHGQLVNQLEHTATSTRDLHSTTAALREVLASPKARGQWGERMADDVLQAAGFREGINYRKQQAIASGRVPDFTFLLPRGLHLHMDVKFPADNYIRFLEAGDDLTRDRCRAAFATDVRNRIKELRTRGYIDPETTVDTMLLFIPNESVYAFVHENDADIIDIALKQKIVLCSPLTLFSVLAVVRQSVDNFRLERRSSEILDFLVEFKSEWTKFTEHMDKTGRQLDTFSKSFESLGGTRRNVLERKLRRIDELEADADHRAELIPIETEADDAQQTLAAEVASARATNPGVDEAPAEALPDLEWHPRQAEAS